MGASHYKGSFIEAGAPLTVGDYIMSPNRRFTGVLQRDGSFAVYWNPTDAGPTFEPATFDPGGSLQLWSSQPGLLFDGYTMQMSVDGDLTITWPVPFPAPLLDTQTAGKGGTQAALLDTGEFQVRSKDGKAIPWRTNAYVKETEAGRFWGIVSDATGPKGMLVVSPANGFEVNGAHGVPGVPPPPACASVHNGNFHPDRAPPEQLWARWDWYAGGKNLLCGTVLINKATGTALGSDGVGRTAMTNTVTQDSLWLFHLLPGEPRLGPLHLAKSDQLNLNIAGDGKDGKYANDTPCLLWNWTGRAPNLLWYFV